MCDSRQPTDGAGSDDIYPPMADPDEKLVGGLTAFERDELPLVRQAPANQLDAIFIIGDVPPTTEDLIGWLLGRNSVTRDGEIVRCRQVSPSDQRPCVRVAGHLGIHEARGGTRWNDLR